jgi:hypothetical protein
MTDAIVTRTWGDGVSLREKVHVIADISYGPESSWLRCRDGEWLTAKTPEDLAFLWLDHGGKVLTFNAEDRLDTSIVYDAERSLKALQALAELGARCTCTDDNDIRDCPNYMEGDEIE